MTVALFVFLVIFRHSISAKGAASFPWGDTLRPRVGREKFLISREGRRGCVGYFYARSLRGSYLFPLPPTLGLAILSSWAEGEGEGCLTAPREGSSPRAPRPTYSPHSGKTLDFKGKIVNTPLNMFRFWDSFRNYILGCNCLRRRRRIFTSHPVKIGSLAFFSTSEAVVFI